LINKPSHYIHTVLLYISLDSLKKLS